MPRSARTLYDSPGTVALDWSGLYDEHAPRLHRIAARRVGVEQASDVVQEIFIRAYRNRESIDLTQSIGAWLSTIALRASTDALRRRSARPEMLVEEDHEPSVFTGGVDEEFENIVRREGIKAAFDSLTEHQQRVFRHLAIDGWTQEQVAADEGMSTEAVKSTYARARRVFKEAYQAFADRMGVFGGAAVGSMLWRLRRQAQRVQGLVTEHVGAIATATATVTVVAIATVPSTRAVPTMADEDHMSNTTAAATTTDSSGSTVAPTGSTGVAVPHGSKQPSASSAPSVTGQDVQGTNDSARVIAEASAGRDGNGAEASFHGSASAPPGEQRAGGGVEVYDCSAKPSSTAICVVVDTASLAAPTPG